MQHAMCGHKKQTSGSAMQREHVFLLQIAYAIASDIESLNCECELRHAV